MSSNKSNIEFLTKFQELTHQLDEVLFFLKQESLITDTQIKSVKSSPDHAKEVYKLLSQLKADGKFQLMEFTWTILPVQYLKIYLITDRNSKEFTYGV
jgi:hypothetical protein